VVPLLENPRQNSLRGTTEAMAELDNTEARSVAAFLAKAGRQPDDMLRFFDRKDYFCLVGRDAETVAVEYFKSTACIKSVQSGGERRSYLSINKKMASEVMRAALLTQRRRVEVYRPDMGSWVLQRRGSPGNLQAFEEECGLDTDAGADTSPVIVAVSIGKTAGSKGYAGNGRLVGVAFIDSTVRSSIRTSELPPTLTPDPNP
jgi:DNA mismatch repair protein MSH2